MKRNRRTNDGLARKESGAAPDATKKHFETFETRFFQQGEDVPAVETEKFDDLDEGVARKSFSPSRQLILSVAIGSVCLALLGCVALWRSASKASEPAAASSESYRPR
jgi:hypothetical protein